MSWDHVPAEKLDVAMGLAWSLTVEVANGMTDTVAKIDARLEELGFRRQIDEYGGVDITYVGPVELNLADYIERRLAFIRDKNWAEADRIRDELAEKGIQLKDSKDPATGERVTTWEVKR